MYEMSLLKLTPSIREKFEGGGRLIANNTSEAMEIEHQISMYYEHKWGGEEKIGFKRIDIKTKEYPIAIYQRDGKLYWDNYYSIED